MKIAGQTIQPSSRLVGTNYKLVVYIRLPSGDRTKRHPWHSHVRLVLHIILHRIKRIIWMERAMLLLVSLSQLAWQCPRKSGLRNVWTTFFSSHLSTKSVERDADWSLTCYRSNFLSNFDSDKQTQPTEWIYFNGSEHFIHIHVHQ